MSNETDLDWLARNVHVWPEGKREVLVCWPRNVDTLIWSSVLSDAGWITKDQWLARHAELASQFKPLTSIEDNQEQVMTQQKDMKQDNKWFERGELPPVGSNVTIVEIDGFGISDLDREFIGDECKVMATFVRPAVFHGDEAKIVAVMEPAGGCCCFRLEMVKPIRTERGVLMDVIVEEMNHYDTDGKLADAILAAGFSLRGK